MQTTELVLTPAGVLVISQPYFSNAIGRGYPAGKHSCLRPADPHLSAMHDHARLEPTAALVMLWSRDLYRTGSAARFCSLLDLSAGEAMRTECDLACPWYNQVILNRKYWIRHLAETFVRGAGTPCQIMLPAAGKSPLALELLDTCGESIASVIEVDIRGMTEKARLYHEAAPNHAGKIRCVTADLFDLSGTAAAIRATGQYDPALPTCIIPEGISYYIPRSLLSQMAALFASDARTNRIIFDYMLPCRLVNGERQKYPRGVWRVINRDCNQQQTITYSPDEIEAALARAGCDRVVHYPMHDIEKLRTGTNRYFPSPPDGWIRIAEGRL